MFLFFNRLLPGFCIVLLLLLATVEITRAQYSFSARLTDENSKAINSATVALFETRDSLLQRATVSDSDGAIRFEGLSLASYYIRIMTIDYSDTSVSIAPAQLSEGRVIKIVLRPKTTDLNAVVVTSAKPLVERKIDRIVFNVENSVSVIGGDAIDALQKAPGVMVHEDNVSLAGKNSVKVMLNDQPLQVAGEDLIAFLKTISADDISRIEVITNPSAAYDAEGNSGIINIVLKKSRRKGLNGNVKAGYTQNKHGTTDAGGSLNYSNDRLNFYSSYNAAWGAEAATERMEIDYPDQRWTKYNTRKVAVANINGLVGTDYKLTKKTTVGIMYNGGYSAPDFNGHITNPIYSYAGPLDSVIRTHTHTLQSAAINSINLNLQYLPGTSGKKLTVDADYFSDVESKNRDVYSSTYPGDSSAPSSSSQTKSIATQQISVYTLKSDLILPYKFVTITVGGKLSFIENNTPASYYNVVNNILYPDSSNTDHFIYKENTQALYASASKEVGKWSMQAGLRGEYTETSGDSKSYSQTNNSSYFRLFPTAYVSYKKNDDNTFSLTYGRRIERPEYWSTNPFKYYSTPYYYGEGNPFLQPSFSNNIELVHNWKNLLNSTFFFSATNNGIDKITEVSDTSNLIVIDYLNFLAIYTYGITETLTLGKLKWLESNSQVTLYHTDAHSSYSGTVADTRSFSCSINTDNTFIFNKARTVMADVNFSYQFPEVEGILINSAHYRLDFGIKLMTPNKKWLIAVNATDILRSEQFASNTTMSGIHQYSYGYYDMQGGRVTVFYKFGKSISPQRVHSSGNEEERRRAQ